MVIKLHDYTNLGQTRPISTQQLEEILATLSQRSEALQAFRTESFIQSLDVLYHSWASPSHPMYTKYRSVGLSYLLSFIRSDALLTFLRRGLRHEYALDGLHDLVEFQGMAVPKGVVGHWVAGNVPMLSIISVLQAILTRNVSVVKLSSRQEDWISPFLHSLAQSGEAGRVMADSVIVLSYPGELAAINNVLASVCDVRVAWGGQEAVQSVASLQGKWNSSTLIFGPKFSCSIIDPEKMKIEDWRKMAIDVVLFNQLACTSPHAIFIKGNEQSVLSAARQLAEALKVLGDRSFYEPLDAGEASKVLNYRTAAWMRGENLLCSNGTEWTLHIHDKLEPVRGWGMKIINLYPFEHVEKIPPMLPETLQTVSHKLSTEQLRAFAHSARHSGVSRIVPVGETHYYDIPWDGMLVLDQLVRWIRVQ